MLHDRPRHSNTGNITVPGVNALQPVAPVVAESHAAGPSDAMHSPARLGWLMLWMSGTLIAFIVAALSVRALSNTLNAFEMMTIRSAGGLAILLVMAAFQPELRHSVRANRMALQGLRNVVHFGSQICWTLAVTMLPFATVFALEFTIPAFVAVLAVLFLGERMTAHRATALVACFIGVLVILRPGFGGIQPAMLIMIAGALLFATAAIATKKLITTEATFSIMLWMNLMQLPMNLLGSDPLFILKLDLSMALPVIGIAGAGLAIHYCLTNAFRCGDAIVVIPMDFLRVPLIALIGWAFYGERLDAVVFAGAALIVGGVLWNVRGEARRNETLAPPATAGARNTLQPAE
jgi:drug/metabolite transporter (DMT)-like permease